jgi:hypothetical protein
MHHALDVVRVSCDDYGKKIIESASVNAWDRTAETHESVDLGNHRAFLVAIV